MKQFTFSMVFAAVTSLMMAGFSSCGNAGSSTSDQDSVAVDSVMVDSTSVDSTNLLGAVGDTVL